MKINSSSLTEAATLANEIEALQTRRDELAGQLSKLDGEIAPLTTKFQRLIGGLGGNKTGRTVKCRRSRTFSAEQKAKISAGLKAKWAERKAAKAAESATNA